MRNTRQRRRSAIDKEDERGIGAFRDEIDRIDSELLDLLNRRAACAQGIGEIKKKNAQPIFVPEREEAVIKHLLEINGGPLPDLAVRDLFASIFSQMKRLEGLVD